MQHKDLKVKKSSEQISCSVEDVTAPRGKNNLCLLFLMFAALSKEHLRSVGGMLYFNLCVEMFKAGIVFESKDLLSGPDSSKAFFERLVFRQGEAVEFRERDVKVSKSIQEWLQVCVSH